MANVTPTRMGGHNGNVVPRNAVVAQTIDGKLYSTRRATLVKDNGAGEALYHDRDAGYFIVRVSRMLGTVPLLDLLPCSDDKLKQWATANGALDLVTTQAAKVLIAKLMATKAGTAALSQLIRKHF